MKIVLPYILHHNGTISHPNAERPFLFMASTLREALEHDPQTEVRLAHSRRSVFPGGDTLIGGSPSDGLFLIFHQATHKRQRLSLTRCYEVQLVAACIGRNAIVVIARPGARLVFSHREYLETVDFDGVAIATQVDKMPGSEGLCHG